MAEQMQLRPEPTIRISTMPRRNESLRRRFWTFHADHPQVYETLVRLAREAQAAGKTRVGIRMLWEVMRWEMFLQTTDPDGFSLNNNLTSRYVRLIVSQEPDLAELFEVRRLRST